MRQTFSRGSVASAALLVSGQRAARSAAGPLFVRGGRSVRLFRDSGRWNRLVAALRRAWPLGVAPTIAAGLPPFQGGAAGLFGYELGRSIERVPTGPPSTNFKRPAMAIGLYDVVVAVDHLENRAWIISQGFPETSPPHGGSRAGERLSQFAALARMARFAAEAGRSIALPPEPASSRRNSRSPGPSGLTSNFSSADYLEVVAGRSSTSAPATCFKSTWPSGCSIRRTTTRCSSICACGGAIRRRLPATSIWASFKSPALRRSGF